MASRGDGTVYQRSDGKWMAQIENGYTATGARRYSRRTRDTKTAAKQALRDLQRSQHNNTPDLDPRLNLKRWADQWLAQQAQHLRPDSYTNTRGHVAKWIIPTIGHRPLSGLTAADARTVEQAILKAGLSATTAGNVRRTLTTCLRAAKTEGHKIPDPILATPTTPPAANTRTAIPLQDATHILTTAFQPDTWPDLPPEPPTGRGRTRTSEQKQMYRRRKYATQTHPSRWVAALLQGLRQGEALGLTWDRINFDAQTIDISWQLKRHPSGATIPANLQTIPLEGQYVLAAPKTRAGQRIIPLTPWATNTLQQWRDQAPPNPHNLVWPRQGGGPVAKNDDLAAWHGLLDAANIRKNPSQQWTLHECRHTTVTLLEAAAAPPAVIIAIVGHSTYASTRRYSHTDLQAARQALQHVGDMLNLPTL